MAKRSSYWVIVSGQQPTSFRAREREELLPTLTQLLRTQPDTTLKYFDQGQLWDTREAADEAFAAKVALRKGRGREWRPGGEHKDPRAKYDIPRDVRRARFKERQSRDRWEPRPGGDRPRDERPRDERPRDERPRDERPRDDRPRDGRPRDDRPRDDRPREKRPWSDRPPRSGDRPWGPPRDGRDDRPQARRPWSDRPPRDDRPRDDRPHGNRPWSDRPPR
jgi:hypothetical protein